MRKMITQQSHTFLLPYFRSRARDLGSQTKPTSKRSRWKYELPICCQTLLLGMLESSKRQRTLMQTTFWWDKRPSEDTTPMWLSETSRNRQPTTRTQPDNPGPVVCPKFFRLELSWCWLAPLQGTNYTTRANCPYMAVPIDKFAI